MPATPVLLAIMSCRQACKLGLSYQQDCRTQSKIKHNIPARRDASKKALQVTAVGMESEANILSHSRF